MSRTTGKDPGGQKTHGKTSKRAPKHREPMRPAESTLAIIDRLLMTPIKVTQDGQNTKITALTAIMRQLLKEEAGGKASASRVLRRYRQLVRRAEERRPEIVFADTDYSRSFASAPREPANG